MEQPKFTVEVGQGRRHEVTVEIKGMTLFEAADWVKKIEDTFGLSAAPKVVSAAGVDEWLMKNAPSCQCGCEQTAPIARRTDARRGQVKGLPMRFIPGHGRNVTNGHDTTGKSNRHDATSENASFAGAVKLETAPRNSNGHVSNGRTKGFSVVLSEVPAPCNKISVIKAIREVTSLGLKEAKELTDETSKPIKEGISQDEAFAIRKSLEAAGAKVEVVSGLV